MIKAENGVITSVSHDGEKMLNICGLTHTIGARALMGYQGSSVYIHDNITAIQDEAFLNSSIESVILPRYLSCMGKGVFKDCSNLLSAIFNTRELELPEDTFANCTNVGAVILPKSCSKISKGAFANCGALVFLKASDNLAEIEEGAFVNCSKLKDIYIPDGVTIDDNAFVNCGSVTLHTPTGSKVVECVDTTPSTIEVSSLTENQFKGNTSLKEVTLKSGITYIPAGCFEGCTNLQIINLNNTVTYINDRVFKDCVSLTAVYGTSNVEKVGHEVFAGCNKLATLFLGDSVTSMEADALNRCDALTLKTHIGSIPQETVSNFDVGLDECTPYNGYPIEKLLQFNLVKRTLQRYCVPDELAFLREHIGDTGNGSPSTVLALLETKVPLPSVFDVDSTGMLVSYNCFTEECAEVPEGVTCIDATAFYGHTELTKIILPSTLKGFYVGIIDEDDVVEDSDCTFKCLPNLEYIDVRNNGTYYSDNGLLCFTADNTVLDCPAKHPESDKHNSVVPTDTLLNVRELAVALSTLGTVDPVNFIKKRIGDYTIMSAIAAADLVYQIDCKPKFNVFEKQFLAEKQAAKEKKASAATKKRNAMAKLGL